VGSFPPPPPGPGCEPGPGVSAGPGKFAWSNGPPVGLAPTPPGIGLGSRPAAQADLGKSKPAPRALAVPATACKNRRRDRARPRGENMPDGSTLRSMMHSFQKRSAIVGIRHRARRRPKTGRTMPSRDAPARAQVHRRTRGSQWGASARNGLQGPGAAHHAEARPSPPGNAVPISLGNALGQTSPSSGATGRYTWRTALGVTWDLSALVLPLRAAALPARKPSVGEMPGRCGPKQAQRAQAPLFGGGHAPAACRLVSVCSLCAPRWGQGNHVSSDIASESMDFRSCAGSTSSTSPAQSRRAVL
jgi:hypothetical protein